MKPYSKIFCPRSSNRRHFLVVSVYWDQPFQPQRFGLIRLTFLIDPSRIPTNNGTESRLGGQKYGECMKMSTPTSLWCYCSYALKWNAGKVYRTLFQPFSPATQQLLPVGIGYFTVAIVCSVTWPLNASKAGGDLASIQTSLLFHSNAN